MAHENRPWRFLSAALAAISVLVTSACGSGRPEGWQEESHGKIGRRTTELRTQLDARP
jgi:hypothetical protein